MPQKKKKHFAIKKKPFSSKLSLSKSWPLVAITLAASVIALTSFNTQEAVNPNTPDLKTRVANLEQKVAAITPDARPSVNHGVNLFFQGGALYWQATESGLDYAVNWNNDTNDDFGGNGRIRHPKFKWDWGFRLGAGYNTPYDGWDLHADWTRFDPGSSRGQTSVPSFNPVTDNPTSVIYPLLLPADGMNQKFGNIGVGFAASMYWKLRLDLLDLELGREFFVSKRLTLRPHAGLRSAWIHQKMNVYYTGNTIGANEIPAQHDFATHLKNNFWGMGLRAGLDGQWILGYGLSLYSELAAALLFGHFSLYESQTPPVGLFGNATTALGVATQSFRERYSATRIAADLAMGLRWNYLFANDRYGFTLQAGWEQHLFINQNQLQKFALGLATSPAHGRSQNGNGLTPITNQGDLSTQGLTMMAQFDF